MLTRLNSVFRKTNRNLQLPLGRWGTIKSDKVTEKTVEETIEKNVISGNHDHCGSEICKIPNNDMKSNNQKNSKFKVRLANFGNCKKEKAIILPNNDTKNSDSQMKKYLDDPYLFYII